MRRRQSRTPESKLDGGELPIRSRDFSTCLCVLQLTFPLFSPIHNWSLCWIVAGCGCRREPGRVLIVANLRLYRTSKRASKADLCGRFEEIVSGIWMPGVCPFVFG